jgi:hypothetical protein
MSSLSYVHPAWCDPANCRPVCDYHVDHRSAPFKMRTNDQEIAVGLARIDDREGHERGGEPEVHLSIEDVASCTPRGDRLVVPTVMSATEARLLAAALVCAAEQREALGDVTS